MTRRRNPAPPAPRAAWESTRALGALAAAIEDASPWGPTRCPRCDAGSAYVGPARLLRRLAWTGPLLRGRQTVHDLDVVFVAQYGDVDRVVFACPSCQLVGVVSVADLQVAPERRPGVPWYSIR